MNQTILSVWNPILRNVSIPIEDIFSDETKILARDLVDSLSSVTGIWLSAPQIGINKRMFCIWIKPTKRSPHLTDTDPLIVINPEIINSSEQQISLLEWCLSIPWPIYEQQIFAEVVRSETIEVWYYNLQGEHIQRTLTGIEARVFLHEYDHLDVILFPERVTNRKTMKAWSEISKTM